MQIDEESEFSNLSKTGIAGKEILEIGCGNGRLSFRLAKIAKKLVAIDPDMKKVENATMQVRPGMQNIEFRAGRGEQLDFPDRRFDVVLYSLSFHHIPIEKQYGALAEAKRVLRPGGAIILYEPLASGQVQRLFLLFEDEVEAMNAVYEAVKTAEADGLVESVELSNFSIKWKFGNMQELVDYFSNEYGAGNVSGKQGQISKIVGNATLLPIILEDELMLAKMVVM